MAKTKEVTYKRGSYKKTGIYRNKTKELNSRKDCLELYQFLTKTKNELLSKFELSNNRSKIVGNLQCLKDYLAKQIKQEYQNKTSEEIRIQKLEEENQRLKFQLELQKELNTDTLPSTPPEVDLTDIDQIISDFESVTQNIGNYNH